MAMAMGGRVAEELIFGYEKVTSGASSDIQYVSNLARSMVKKWGMSEVVGPVFHGDDNENPFLGYSLGKKDGVSEETLNKIDDEVKILISEAHDRAKKILEDNIDKLHTLSLALLEHETLTGDEIKDVMNGKDVDKKFSSKSDQGKHKKSSFGLKGDNDNASDVEPLLPPSAAPQGA